MLKTTPLATETPTTIHVALGAQIHPVKGKAITLLAENEWLAFSSMFQGSGVFAVTGVIYLLNLSWVALQACAELGDLALWPLECYRPVPCATVCSWHCRGDASRGSPPAHACSPLPRVFTIPLTIIMLR